MRVISLLVAMAVLLLLPSCYSMSKEECVVANWKVIGESDGSSGYNPQNRFAEHVKSCARVKIAPDQTVWYAGFQEGLKRYCTPLSGASHGEAGDGYNNVCPPDREQGFMQGYSAGKRVHDLRAQLDSIRSDIDFRENDTRRGFDELKTAKDQDRGVIQRRIDDNDFAVRRLRRDADDVAYQLSGAERDLAWFRSNPQMTMPPRR